MPPGPVHSPGPLLCTLLSTSYQPPFPSIFGIYSVNAGLLRTSLPFRHQITDTLVSIKTTRFSAFSRYRRGAKLRSLYTVEAERRLNMTHAQTNSGDGAVKVLIADDSLLVCVRLMSVLSKLDGLELAGYTRDAASAIESVSRLKPDIVAIMLTNLSHQQYRKKCMDAGADFFFDKSTEFFEMAELFEHLAQRTHSLTSIGTVGGAANQAAR